VRRPASQLGERERAAVSELWDELEREVEIRLDLGPVATPVALLAAGGREIDTNAETRSLVEGLCELSDRVRLEVVEHDEAGTYPTLSMGDGLRYVGLPWGYELATFVHGVAETGRRSSSLTTESLSRLADVERPVAVDVFVTPT
jgi:alkyl hydroperoxide reductase subunit AhpF